MLKGLVKMAADPITSEIELDSDSDIMESYATALSGATQIADQDFVTYETARYFGSAGLAISAESKLDNDSNIRDSYATALSDATQKVDQDYITRETAQDLDPMGNIAASVSQLAALLVTMAGIASSQSVSNATASANIFAI